MFLNRNVNVIMTGTNIENVKKIEHILNSRVVKSNIKARVTGYELNFTDLDNSNILLNKLKNKEIKPTYLINNAGALMLNNIKNVTPRKMKIMYEVNTFGPLLLTKYCIDEMFKNNSESDTPKFVKVIGKSNKAEAKIAGITPAVFIFKGKWDDSPP